MNIFRGDIFYIKGVQSCVDLKEGRPAIIVSNNMCNTHSDRVEVVYLTTRDKKPLPTHVEIICRQKSTALCEQIHTVPKESIGEFIKVCTSAEMQRIDEALMVSLGLVSEQIQTEEPYRKQIKGFCVEETAPDLIKTERDLYKKLYEQLLDKITG
jgi:mRNA interferase MazF